MAWFKFLLLLDPETQNQSHISTSVLHTKRITFEGHQLSYGV